MGSPREPVQTRAHKTRAALLLAAAAELNQRGYAQTTTKSIADRVDVAAGSFYQYFADKDAVLRELASNPPGQGTRTPDSGLAARVAE